MARDWEAAFSAWTGRASDAEQSRYEWTRNQIDDALRGNARLAQYSFKVYAKGSYPNFTNVVRDSDVDVAAELTTLFQNDFIGEATGLGLADVGLTPYTGDANLARFKDDVHLALVDHFGSGPVDRGTKAIHIRESSRGLAADVVPCVTHRTYFSRTYYEEGIRLRNDARPNDDIENYPEQHLERGTPKNDATSRRYKRVVRILKRLENEMVEGGIIGPVPSFLIESAVFNVANDDFDYASWAGRVMATLAHIFNGTMNNECVSSSQWMEVNGIKYLFHANQSWTHEQAHEFASKAWDYVGFG
jgi:hypothetical protein